MSVSGTRTGTWQIAALAYGFIQSQRPQAIAASHNLEDTKLLIIVSQIIVLLIAVTVIVLAGWGMFAPEKLMAFVSSAMDKYWGIYIAVIVRLLLGSALIIVAPVSLFPMVFHVLGVIAIVAALALVVMGRERIRRFIAWWSQRFSASIVRMWLLFGIAFGGFLVYGVL